MKVPSTVPRTWRQEMKYPLGGETRHPLLNGNFYIKLPVVSSEDRSAGRIGGLLGRTTGERRRDDLETRAQGRQREWTKRKQGK